MQSTSFCPSRSGGNRGIRHAALPSTTSNWPLCAASVQLRTRSATAARCNLRPVAVLLKKSHCENSGCLGESAFRLAEKVCGLFNGLTNDSRPSNITALRKPRFVVGNGRRYTEAVRCPAHSWPKRNRKGPAPQRSCIVLRSDRLSWAEPAVRCESTHCSPPNCYPPVRWGRWSRPLAQTEGLFRD